MTIAKHRCPVRVETHPAAAGVTTQRPRSNVTVGLSEPGSAERWQQLQGLRRRPGDVDPWLEQVLVADGHPEPDLLAALVPVLDRSRVERLLAGPVGQEPVGLLSAVQQEWPALAAESAFQEAWLEPLLFHCERLPLSQRLGWLQLLGLFRDPRVAALLRQAIADAPPCEAGWPLLPLLGLQRHPQDGELLEQLALNPGPRALRQQAVEGLALGLSAWPSSTLIQTLSRLLSDLDGGLASQAVDLLARLPAGVDPLRRSLTRSLAPEVQQRVHRRLRCSPLVLLVHGRRDGRIPQELEDLAKVVAHRRGAPVCLQALTAAPPDPEPLFWQAAQRAGALSLVPLLLVPGEHVRTDLPRLAATWRTAARSQEVALRRLSFLGAWPAWQAALADAFRNRQEATQRPGLWLYHPLQGALADRFLAHLGQVLDAPALSASYSDPMASLRTQPSNIVVLPLTLAANRLSEALQQALPQPSIHSDQPAVLPPLLQWPELRAMLIDALTLLP